MVRKAGGRPSINSIAQTPRQQATGAWLLRLSRLPPEGNLSIEEVLFDGFAFSLSAIKLFSPEVPFQLIIIFLSPCENHQRPVSRRHGRRKRSSACAGRLEAEEDGAGPHGGRPHARRRLVPPAEPRRARRGQKKRRTGRSWRPWWQRRARRRRTSEQQQRRRRTSDPSQPGCRHAHCRDATRFRFDCRTRRRARPAGGTSGSDDARGAGHPDPGAAGLATQEHGQELEGTEVKKAAAAAAKRLGLGTEQQRAVAARFRSRHQQASITRRLSVASVLTREGGIVVAVASVDRSTRDVGAGRARETICRHGKEHDRSE